MKITRDASFEDAMIQGLRDHFAYDDKKRDKDDLIHVSQLIYCQRKPILQSLLPGASGELDRTTILKFVIGRNQHSTMQSIKANQRGSETAVVSEGVIGTMDVLNPKGVVELKGSRSSLRKHDVFGVDSEADYYTRQVESYCALCYVKYPNGYEMLLDKEEQAKALTDWGHYGAKVLANGKTLLPRELFLHGHLAIVYINGAYDAKGYDGMNPDLRAWRLEFSAKELEDWYALLQGRKQRILDTRAFLASSKGKLKELQDAVTSELLPQGPAYGFECGTAEAGCAFHRVCYP